MMNSIIVLPSRHFHASSTCLRKGLRIPPLFRVDKITARGLFRYFTQIDIKFFPLDERSNSARELYSQMSSPKLSKINPKCKVNIEVERQNVPASATIKFVDGSEVVLDTGNYNVEQLKSELWMHATLIENSFEDQGKSIEDM
uniref:Large ribosomal subunit protein mL53 n=1 Tax=Heterosigma akashiwo TaxID=2829 RepID=A0A6V1WD33_HETAK|mmetsp:Transcript_10214/g.14292  ORF Transcript_10214/g.14292 Transcript_10214/m.14292 type:complete len:143 (+) Transcript_10214:37-465(+)